MSSERKRIVVGVDFSPGSEVALRHALDIAHHVGAEVTLVQVGWVPTPPPGMGQPDLWEVAGREGGSGQEAALRELAARAGDHGVTVTTRILAGRPAETLSEYAAESGAHLLAIGVHGQTRLARLTMGSISERTVRHASSPALVARGAAPKGGYRRALVAVELGRNVDAQIRLALELTNGFGPIDVLHSWTLPVFALESATLYARLHEDTRVAVERSGRELLAPYASSARAVEFIGREGPATSTILGLLDEGQHDLVILGSHQRTGPSRWILGSVAEAVVRHAPCSALVVPLT